MEKRELIQHIRTLPFFKVLDESSIEKLAGYFNEEIVKRGEIVIREGGPGNALYFVISGEANVLKTIDRKQHKSKSLGIIGPQELFGEMAPFDLNPRSATVKAVTEMRLLRISTDDFRRFLVENTESGIVVLTEVIALLSRRMREAARELVAVYEAGKAIASGADADEVAERVLQAVVQVVPSVDAGLLALFNPFSLELEIRKYVGFAPGSLDGISWSIVDPLLKAELEQRVCRAGPPTQLEIFTGEAFSRALSMVSCPLVAQENFLGILAFFNFSEAEVFTPAQRNLVTGMCSLVAPVFENADLHREDQNRQRLHQYRW